MDLDAVLAAGWADPAAFSPEEFAAATAFWLDQRRHDARLKEVRAHASDLIVQWTGRTPRDVGSFGTQMNLDSSDLDLAIGYPLAQRPLLARALDGMATFKGERWTSTHTTRLVFAFTCEDIEIDLSVLTEEDFVVDNRMLDALEAGLSREERIAHTWVKHLLRDAARYEDYAAWKLVVYARYCPEFNWVPIPEKQITLPEDVITAR